MAHFTRTLTRTAPRYLASTALLILAGGCYTQLGYQYMDREPDYEEVTVYETQTGDSVVVDKYYYDGAYTYADPHRYRRYFSRYYGYPSYLYDPWYDDFGYGSSISLNVGFGRPWYLPSYSPFAYNPFWSPGHYGYGYGYGGYGYGYGGYGYGYGGYGYGYIAAGAIHTTMTATTMDHVVLRSGAARSQVVA